MTVPDPANGNWPIVNLRAIGDGRAVIRTLVRVLTRRMLISEGLIPNAEHCEIETRAG